MVVLSPDPCFHAKIVRYMGLKCSGREDSSAGVLQREQGGYGKDALGCLSCTRVQLMPEVTGKGTAKVLWQSDSRNKFSTPFGLL